MPLKLVMVMNAHAAQAIPIGKEGKVILLMTLCPRVCVCGGVPDQTLFLSRQARRFWRMWFFGGVFWEISCIYITERVAVGLGKEKGRSPFDGANAS